MSTAGLVSRWLPARLDSHRSQRGSLTVTHTIAHTRSRPWGKFHRGGSGKHPSISKTKVMQPAGLKTAKGECKQAKCCPRWKTNEVRTKHHSVCSCGHLTKVTLTASAALMCNKNCDPSLAPMGRRSKGPSHSGATCWSGRATVSGTD